MKMYVCERNAAADQRGSALFLWILLLITSRAHQTTHNYSHSALIYSNAVSHLQDNYEQFFSHVESFVNKRDSALKENLLCAEKKKKTGRVKSALGAPLTGSVIRKAGKLLAGVYGGTVNRKSGQN